MDIVRVVYSDHLTARLELRQIDEALPRLIIQNAERSYRDTATGYLIAVATAPDLGADHVMMVAFELNGDVATAITIHPLEERDVELKVRSGRWQP